jgi:hypothetical protein
LSRFLAIDVDSQGLFVVAGTARGGAARVEHAISWADDADPPPPLTLETAKVVGEQLRERLKAAGVPAAPVVVAIGRDKVIPKEVRYPVVAPAEEPALVRFQALKEITENPDDVVLDYAPLANGVPDPAAERRAMVVVVRKEVFAAVQAMCAAAGLKLAAVTPRPFAVAAGLTRAFATGAVLPPDNPADAVAVLTTGPQGGEFTVVRDGQIVFTRSVPAHALANEHLLVNELRRNLTIYAGQNPGHAARAVYVAESEDSVRGWTSRLRLGLNVPVHAFDPLNGYVPEVVPELRGRYAGAAGLLAGRAADALPINFAEPRRPRATSDPRKRQLVLAGAVAAALVLAGGIFGLTEYVRASDRLANLQAEKEVLEKSIADMEGDAKRLDAVDQWSKREVVWLDELYELADRLPSGDTIRLTSLETKALPVNTKTGKQDAQALLTLQLAAKTTDAGSTLRYAFERDNPPDKLKWYTAFDTKPNSVVGGNVAFNQLFTFSAKVNHRPPEKYTTAAKFTTPFRRSVWTTPAEDADK